MKVRRFIANPFYRRFTAKLAIERREENRQVTFKGINPQQGKVIEVVRKRFFSGDLMRQVVFEVNLENGLASYKENEERSRPLSLANSSMWGEREAYYAQLLWRSLNWLKGPDRTSLNKARKIPPGPKKTPTGKALPRAQYDTVYNCLETLSQRIAKCANLH